VELIDTERGTTWKREVVLPTYGLLHTDRDGRLIERRQIECANDSDAVRAARALVTPQGEVVVVQDARRVDTLNGAANAAASPLTNAAD